MPVESQCWAQARGKQEGEYEITPGEFGTPPEVTVCGAFVSGRDENLHEEPRNQPALSSVSNSDDPGHFDESYYQTNGQIGDRPALGYYVRLIQRYGASGPYFDFGCGTGHLLRRLSALGPSAGFEISEFSAARARETAPGCAVVTSLADIPDNSIGTLAAIHVVEHVDDDTADQIISVWKRALRAGGRIMVVTPDLGGRAHRMLGESWNAFSDPTHINLKSHGQWRRFLTDRGLEVVFEGSDGMWDPPYADAPRLWDAARFSVPALTQFLAGRLLVPPGAGESSIYVLEAR